MTGASNFDMSPFGGSKYLWGYVPAVDVLRLPKNEGAGAGFNEDCRLLFAGTYMLLQTTICT